LGFISHFVYICVRKVVDASTTVQNIQEAYFILLCHCFQKMFINSKHDFSIFHLTIKITKKKLKNKMGATEIMVFLNHITLVSKSMQ